MRLEKLGTEQIVILQNRPEVTGASRFVREVYGFDSPEAADMRRRVAEAFEDYGEVGQILIGDEAALIISVLSARAREGDTHSYDQALAHQMLLSAMTHPISPEA